MSPSTPGLHHVTAIAGDPTRNAAFYVDALGLRFVKRTVSHDDTHTYHFYFGDVRGTPGTDTTFFPWTDDGPRGRAGAGQARTVAYLIRPESIGYWTDRLRAHGVDVTRRERFDETVLRFGRGGVAALAADVEAHGATSALVVTGRTVGETAAVMDPVRAGLGDRLAGVFAETTPEKRLGTALDGRAALRESGADALVAVGGGSSLDVARAVAALAARGDDPASAGAEFAETGTLAVPATGVPPIVAVPTTLAGADLSRGGGLTAAPGTCPVDEPASGGLSDRGLLPATVCWDPDLLATTPRSALAGSAMNGFDKGVETIYARAATPVTDATAARGLSRLEAGLRAFGAGDDDPATYDALAEGAMLVQYGVSRADGSTLSIVHAFGHGVSGGYDVQQEVAHAVVVPHVLRYVFDSVDGRRDELAAALGVGRTDRRDDAAETLGGDGRRDDAAGTLGGDGRTDPVESVVATVTEVRDALDLPSRLRDVDGPSPDEFDAVARAVVEDSLAGNGPPGLDPTVDDVRAVLEAAC